MTLSIVARDPITGALGVATATAGPSVGALVVHGAAGVGAIATQAMTNPLYGIHGIEHLRSGLSAALTLERLLSEDDHAEGRQVMIVDANGEIAHWSGGLCGTFAACLPADECLVGGNLLLNEHTLTAMLDRYHQTETEAFADRLFTALEAGARAGGDKRGIRSAALKIWIDREYASVDARIDWSETPLDALKEVIRQQRSRSYADFFVKLPKGTP
jgi:uncharacterized Ntn-hydrolase superfamily protein